MTVLAASMLVPVSQANEEADDGQRSVRPARDGGERADRPRRRRAPPLILDNYNKDCLVSLQQQFCLNGPIDAQLKYVPFIKSATYGIRDVYKLEPDHGPSVTLYVIDDRIANILLRYPAKPKRGKGGRGGRGAGRDGDGRRPPRKGEGRGPARAIVQTIEQHVAEAGFAKTNPDRQETGRKLREIMEKGEGSLRWRLDAYELYYKFNNDRSMLVEAWVPALEQKEDAVVRLAPGSKLSGVWHNKHPVEIMVGQQTSTGVTGTVRFTQLQQGRYQNPVQIEQGKSGGLKITRQVEDGTVQHLVADRPLGDGDGCYQWQLLLQDKNNSLKYSEDGTLKLCP